MKREEKVRKNFFTFAGKLYIMYKSAGCGSVWLERTAGGREVAGSNPVTPIGTETIRSDQVKRLTETGSLSIIMSVAAHPGGMDPDRGLRE